MIDFDRIEAFDRDAGNAAKSSVKHGVSPAEAEQVFFNKPLILLQDDRHSQQEARYHALGKTNDGRMLHIITFTLRYGGTRIRVISSRNMHRKERTVYEKKAKASDQET